MSPSAKASLELGVGLFVVGVRFARSRMRRAQQVPTSTGAVEASMVTAAGLLELIGAEYEHHNGVERHAGLQYRYTVTVDGIQFGHVTALLDHGTDSAVVVPALEAGDPDVLVPEVLAALIECLAPRNPWLRRVSIALHPRDTVMARALHLRGFDCEGEVPGYVEDERGTRRQFWTTMINRDQGSSKDVRP